MAAAFKEAGARVEIVPVTHLEPHVDAALLEIKLAAVYAAEGWLVLPSPSAVEIFLDAVRRMQNFGEIRKIPVATIGPAGAAPLAKAGFERVFTPPAPNAAALARTLPAAAGTEVSGAPMPRARNCRRPDRTGASVARLSLSRPPPTRSR